MAILWPGQRNGQISLNLMSLLLGYRLHPAAAVSFLAMRAALFAATGVWIGISDAYRSFAEQDRVFRQRYTSGWKSGIWYAGTYWRKRAGVAVAAVPGTSNHGWALALDINNYGPTNGRVFRWLLDHAAAFGWSWTTGRNVNEPWHWEYVGSLARPAGGDITPITATNGAHAMMIHWNEPDAVIKPGKSGQYHATEGPRNHFLVFDGPILVDEFYADSLSGTQAKANAYAKQCGGSSVLVSKADYDKTRARIISAGGFDAAALAQALAGLVVNVAAGPTKEEIATAVADELHKRTAQ